MAVQKKPTTNTRLAQTLPNVPPKASPLVTPQPFQFIPQVNLMDQVTNIPTTFPAAPGMAGGAGGGLPSFPTPQQSMSTVIDDENPDYSPPPLPSPRYTYGSPSDVVGGQNNNQTNQPPVSGPELGFDRSSQGWGVDKLAEFAPQFQGTTPDFTGGMARNFMQESPPTPYLEQQRQYDPQRAQEIMRGLSFMPLVSLLGGDVGYAQRLMPSIAAQAIGGDKAYYDEGQVLNQRYLAGRAKAQQQDIANDLDYSKLAQAASEDATKRAIAQSQARMAQEELKQKTAELQERMLNNLRGSEVDRANTAREYQSWLSMLDPQSQIAYDRALDPSFKAFYGVGLPKDEQGNPIPLNRANPNEPTEKMAKQKLLDNLLEQLGKNPEYQTPEGQRSLLMQINSIMDELGLSPEAMFTAPVTTNQSPTQRAEIALGKERVGIARGGLAIEAQRAGTYDKSVNNQFKLGTRELDQKSKMDAFKMAQQGQYGPLMKSYSDNYFKAESAIRSATAQINKIAGGYYDTMLGRWKDNTPAEIKKKQPLIDELNQSLTEYRKRSNYYGAMMMSGLSSQPAAGVAPPPQGGEMPPPSAAPSPSTPVLSDLEKSIIESAGRISKMKNED